MTNTEITALAREYAEESIDPQGFSKSTYEELVEENAENVAYVLGKQEKDVEKTNTDDCVTISLHVAVIPCQEEFYMGVDASHEAYTIDIPKSIIPSDLLAVINGECKNKVVTNIAIMK